MPASRTRKTAEKKTTTRRAPGRGPSSIADFKTRKPEPDEKLLELPSGLVIQADRRNVMSSFLQTGVIPNPLMERIQEAITTGKEMTEAEAMQMAQDPSQVELLTAMMQNVICQVCVEPMVHPIPSSGRRSTAKLYVDELDEVDSMFIFQWATGGTSDLESFRQQSRGDMASLLRGQGVQPQAKRTRRS